MKLKYDCQTYDSKGFPFSIVAKGKEIRVLQVDRKTVKIEWDREGDSKYKTGFGYISHRQFIICVEDKSFVCGDCSMFGNCIEKNPYKQACSDFIKMEEK